MARTNTPTVPTSGKTHEGAPARRINAAFELARSVESCLLWEGEFYEDGESIAERIEGLAQQVEPEKVAALAVRARSEFKLRHVPLWLCVALARRGALKAETLADVIQRADEMGEFLSLYWKEGRVPLAAQVKKGLALAFTKFDAYQLGKYDRDAAVRLRDIMFLVHPKPGGVEQAATWKLLAAGALPAPDTWEVALSGGADKRETWIRLLAEKRLGYMALLRNLRNMKAAEVPEATVFAALKAGAPKSRALPFRFIAAADAVPQWEPALEEAMLAVTLEQRLPGKTLLLIDVSGSMDERIGEKSELTRLDSACGLAILAREVCERVEVFSFSRELVAVPPRRGFALRDAILTSQPHNATFLGAAVSHLNGLPADRLIVVTDEQSHDAVPGPAHDGYMINVASYQRGVGYGPWTHLDGFSEAVLTYIAASE